MRNRIFVILLFISCAGFQVAGGQETSEKSSDQADYTERMEELSKRLNFRGGTLKEYMEAARYQEEKGNATGFKTAKSLLEDAISKYDGQLDLTLFYAQMLYKHGFESEALNRLEDLTDQNNTCWPAWYRLGEIYRKRMSLYRNQISSKGWSYDQYAEEYFHLAEQAFRKCSENNYGGDSLIVNVFWLYYDSNNYQPAARLMDAYLQKPRSSAELYELAGFIHVRLKEYAMADTYYQSAFSKMSEEQRLPYIISKNYLNIHTQYLTTDQHITLEDPLRLTAYNERELAHMARVTYAQERFSSAFAHEQGWQSDPGKILIRYGFPQEEIRVRGEVEGATFNEMETPDWRYSERQRMYDYGYRQQRSATQDIFDTKMPVYWDFLTWHYPDFQVSFDDEFNNGQYQFAEKSEFATRAKSRAEISYSFFAEEMFNTKPETYTLTTKGGEVTSVYELHSNLMEQNRIDLTFNYMLSPPDYKNRESWQAWQFALYRSRHEANTFREFSIWKTGTSKDKIWQRDSSLYGQQKFTAFAGIYDWIFEGYNKLTQAFFRYQFTDTIPDMNPRRLTMGDIQVGFLDQNRIEEPAEIPDIPNASHKFNTKDRVVISFDVNGLDTLDSENGLLIQYTITPLDEPRSIWEMLGSIFVGADEANLGVSISNEYPVREGWQHIKQILDVRNLSPSRYNLNVAIEEQATKKNLNREIEFKLQ